MTLHQNFAMKHISVPFNGTQSTCHALHPRTVFHDPLFKIAFFAAEVDSVFQPPAHTSMRG